MLHVKHRHVLVDRHLEPVRRRGLQQRVELRDVQVVAGRDAFEAEMIFEIVRREAVRHVQREIPDPPRVREKFQVVVVADEITVGVARADLVENPLVTRLEDARRRDEDAGRGWRIENGRWRRAAARGVKRRHRLAVFLRVFKLAIHRRHAALQRGIELR